MRPRPVFQSTISYVAAAVAPSSRYTASMRPRTTRPASVSWNGRLDAVRRAVGVRGALEGLLERLQVALVGDLARRVAGQLVRVEHGQGSASKRDSTQAWKRVPRRRGGLRRAGHGAGQLLREAVGVGGQPQQLGGGQRGGQRDVA